MEYEQIRERIKKTRRALNYTQEYVAECLKISTNSYREIESGKTSLINPRLKKISEILKLPIETLIFGHVTKEECLESIEKLNNEHRKQIQSINTKHKIEIAEKEGEINMLKTKLETKEKIIGVLNEQIEKY